MVSKYTEMGITTQLFLSSSGLFALEVSVPRKFSFEGKTARKMFQINNGLIQCLWANYKKISVLEDASLP